MEWVKSLEGNYDGFVISDYEQQTKGGRLVAYFGNIGYTFRLYQEGSVLVLQTTEGPEEEDTAKRLIVLDAIEGKLREHSAYRLLFLTGCISIERHMPKPVVFPRKKR